MSILLTIPQSLKESSSTANSNPNGRNEQKLIPAVADITDKMSMKSRVDSVMKPSSTTSPSTEHVSDISTSNYLTTQIHATKCVFAYLQTGTVFCISRKGYEVLYALQSCILDVIETGKWRALSSLQFDLDDVRQALEVLSTAARWKAEDKNGGGGLQECLEYLGGAAKYGVQILEQGSEEDEEIGEGLGEMYLGVLEFVQRVTVTLL
jgi:hypothetical protein